MNCPFCNQSHIASNDHYVCPNYSNFCEYLQFSIVNNSINNIFLKNKEYIAYVSYLDNTTIIVKNNKILLLNYAIKISPENFENKIKTILLFQ